MLLINLTIADLITIVTIIARIILKNSFTNVTPALSFIQKVLDIFKLNKLITAQYVLLLPVFLLYTTLYNFLPCCTGKRIRGKSFFKTGCYNRIPFIKVFVWYCRSKTCIQEDEYACILSAAIINIVKGILPEPGIIIEWSETWLLYVLCNITIMIFRIFLVLAFCSEDLVQHASVSP